MTMTIKPDMTKIWADTGAKVQPPEAKIASGWGYEMMPFEWENWIQNRNDSMLSHINQRGIPEWDANTEYFANKSYVTGSNGLVYAALVNNTNVNPVSDVTGKWVRAFPSVTGGGASGTWSISVSGNSATTTKLATARGINTVLFDGTSNITVEPYVERDDSTNATRYLTFVDSSTAGHQRLNMDLGLTYNPSTGVLAATITGNAATATKWATSRSISITGDATWTVSLDGSANATAALTLAGSGVVAGTYNNVATQVRPFTVDAKGRITAIGDGVLVTPAFSSVTGKPTTLDGYGITDAAPSSHVGATGGAHGVATTSTAGFMSSADKTKLDGVAVNANNYVHPTTDGNLHVPATGTNSQNKVLVAGATPGSFSWVDFDFSYMPLASIKHPVKVATTGAITLAGLQTIDGVALAEGDRVLVKDQSNSINNGIYVASAGAWVRAADSNTPEKLSSALVSVALGTAHAGRRFQTNFNPTGVIGTNEVVWARLVDTRMASTVVGSAPGTAASGTSFNYARQDHVHPVQTTITGNAATATKLETARLINDVSFDGSSNIHVQWKYSDIPASADLNNYNSQGLFRCPSNSVGATLTNAPIANPFTLRVYSTADNPEAVLQEVVSYHPNTSRRYYQRTCHSGTWSAWSNVYTSVDPQTTITGNAGSATVLQTGRTISMTGDVTWTSASFDGSANVTGTATLANSGVTAGTYNNVANKIRPFTVDAKGRITSVGTEVTIAPNWSDIVSKPTTLSGYGITDAAPKNSPAFTGVPTVPTATAGTNTTQIASTAFVTSAVSAVTGRLLNVRVFTTANSGSTYTPTAGTTSVVVEAVGAGGGGGGAKATNSSQYSYGTGGDSGKYGKARFTSGFSGVTLTIGSGGTGVAGNTGNSGGNTSFGSLLVCPGGSGGLAINQTTTTQISMYGSFPTASAVTGANIMSHHGFPGIGGRSNGTFNTNGDSGCSSYLGNGGGIVSLGNAGLAATGYGGGGGGACNDVSNTARAGGNGGDGVIIVYEYA